MTDSKKLPPHKLGSPCGELNRWEWLYSIGKGAAALCYTGLVYMAREVQEVLPFLAATSPLWIVVLLGVATSIIVVTHESKTQKWSDNTDREKKRCSR